MKDRIVLQALQDAPAQGWSMEALRLAAKACGQKPQMADALFDSIHDAGAHLSDLFDRRMMEQLESIDAGNMRVRDRIATAVQTRLDLMAPYRDGLRLICQARMRMLKNLWRSADQIWVWAGDTATDYNHYTKRALLSGVMASTFLFWLNDNSSGYAATRAFLSRRIENVLTAGKFLGTLGKRKTAA